MKRKLWCTGHHEFEALMKDGLPAGAAAISIIGTPEVLSGYLREPETTHPLPDSEWVLNLEFDDITKDTLVYRGITAIGISGSQARRIVEFLEKAVAESRDIYIHCRAGRSRSQAIVRYVQSRWEGPWETNPENPPETPNYYVLGKLRDEEQNIHPA